MLFDYHPKLVERMVRDTPKTIATVTILSLMLIWIYSPYVPNRIICYWSLAQVIFIFFRYLNYRILEKHLAGKDYEKIKFNIVIFFIIIVYSAILWTVATLSWLCYAPPTYEYVSLVFIVGIINGGTISLSPIYVAYLIYFNLLLFPQLILFASYGDRAHSAVIVFSVVFIPYIYMISKSMHNNIIKEIDANEILEENVIKLKEISITDPLTNIGNRRYFFDASENIFKLSMRENIDISLLMMDIDFFKKINDTYGHQFGDVVLVKTAENIKNMTRASDIFCRVGGEEFALLLYNASRENGLKIAGNICEMIDKTTIEHDGISLNITISIGLSTSSEEFDTIPLMCKGADEKLYLAKEAGRNCVR